MHIWGGEGQGGRHATHLLARQTQEQFEVVQYQLQIEFILGYSFLWTINQCFRIARSEIHFLLHV